MLWKFPTHPLCSFTHLVPYLWAFSHGQLAHFIVRDGAPGEHIFESCANGRHHLAINMAGTYTAHWHTHILTHSLTHSLTHTDTSCAGHLVGTGGMGPFARFRAIHHSGRTVTFEATHGGHGYKIGVDARGQPLHKHHAAGPRTHFDIEEAGRCFLRCACVLWSMYVQG